MPIDSRLSVRARALLEVLLCSGFPTQLVIISLLWALGMAPRHADGRLSLTFVSVLSLLDTALLLSLIWFLLLAGGERPRDVFVGRRAVAPEAARGLLLVPVSFLVAIAVLALARLIVPSLHNVAINPFEGILQTNRDRVIVGVVVTIAGGLREEVQRAFILHRFEQSLGGAWLGLGLFSLAFGAGHLAQGRDVALATAALGAFWGAIYLRRRSIVSPSVAHAGFNLSEIVRHSIASFWSVLP